MLAMLDAILNFAHSSDICCVKAMFSTAQYNDIFRGSQCVLTSFISGERQKTSADPPLLHDWRYHHAIQN